MPCARNTATARWVPQVTGALEGAVAVIDVDHADGPKSGQRFGDREVAFGSELRVTGVTATRTPLEIVLTPRTLRYRPQDFIAKSKAGRARAWGALCVGRERSQNS